MNAEEIKKMLQSDKSYNKLEPLEKQSVLLELQGIASDPRKVQSLLNNIRESYATISPENRAAAQVMLLNGTRMQSNMTRVRYREHQLYGAQSAVIRTGAVEGTT